MTKGPAIELTDVDASNVDKLGFFCQMSKRGTPGYENKLTWLKGRFAEGMRLKLITKGGRGFIEYGPGENAWRPVQAKGYMFINCIWVVGKAKGQGCGAKLLAACIKDAKKSKMKGVALVTSESVWLADKAFFEHHGFVSVDTAPPSFHLMVKSFTKGTKPKFTGSWDKKAKRLGKGMTIVRTPQCPYIEDATDVLLSIAKKRKLEAKVVDLKSAKDVREKSPFAYGTFGIVLDGTHLAYHYLLEKDFDKLMKQR